MSTAKNGKMVGTLAQYDETTVHRTALRIGIADSTG